jgi:uncharacterized membrane protein|tara:strand:+ start:720 stop:1079 length:360 start_codon:yes stop_codon:yes gene_type:complete
MIALLLLALVIYTISTLLKKETNTTDIQNIIKETHKYSGINPTVYKEFIANINMALEYRSHVEVSKKLLTRAINNLEEIGLNVVSGDTDIQDKLHDLSVKIVVHFNELHIREEINQLKE